MRASEIKVSSLNTYRECADAIELIENDYENVVGGHKAFFSGRATELTAGAKKKIAAIEAKMEKFPDYDDE